MGKKVASRTALEAWQGEEAEKEQARKDARIVSACWIYIKNMEHSKPITEGQLRAALEPLGEIKDLKILFTNLEEA